jgi:hypothetical protein
VPPPGSGGTLVSCRGQRCDVVFQSLEVFVELLHVREIYVSNACVSMHVNVCIIICMYLGVCVCDSLVLFPHFENLFRARACMCISWLCTYVCMYVRMYVCMYVYVYAYVRASASVCSHLCVSMHACIYTRFVNVYACVVCLCMHISWLYVETLHVMFVHVCLRVSLVTCMYHPHACMSACIYHVTLFAFELAGQDRQPSRFPVQNKAFGRISYGIKTSVKEKSARLCLFPGQLKRKQLYVCVHACVYVRMHVCIHARMYVLVYVST